MRNGTTFGNKQRFFTLCSVGGDRGQEATEAGHTVRGVRCGTAGELIGNESERKSDELIDGARVLR